MSTPTDLAAFVAAAHRNGYASDDPDVVDDEDANGEGGGTVLHFEDGPWRYRDVYHGSTAFVGHEVVYRDDEPVWGMSYYGDLMDGGGDRHATYAFLQDALGRATAERPFRGPGQYESSGRAYRSTVEGTLDRFQGTEEIRRDGAVTYRGTFGGGRVD